MIQKTDGGKYFSHIFPTTFPPGGNHCEFLWNILFLHIYKCVYVGLKLLLMRVYMYNMWVHACHSTHAISSFLLSCIGSGIELNGQARAADC